MKKKNKIFSLRLGFLKQCLKASEIKTALWLISMQQIQSACRCWLNYWLLLLKGNINGNCSNVSSSWKLKNKTMLKEELLCTPRAKNQNTSFALFCTKNLKLWPIIILLKLSFFVAAKEDRNNGQLLEQIVSF